MKRTEKTLQRYKIGARKQNSRADHTAHEENKFYAAKVKFYAAGRICGSNRTTGKNLAWQMNSQSGEEYYAATVILPRDKQEKRNAALKKK